MRSLKNPKNISLKDGKELDDKLSTAKAVLARSPQNGGMPFVYAFAASKEHVLEDKIGHPIEDPETGEKTWPLETAMTNGIKYFWHPNFLRNLTIKEITVVIAHETYHIVLQHCNPNRSFGKNPKIWNIAIDYVVNSTIEHDLRYHNQINSHDCDKSYNSILRNYDNISKHEKHPIWGGNFGYPVPLKNLLKDIEKWAKQQKSGITSLPKPKKDKDDKAMSGVFADYSLHKRSAESIYDEIMNQVRKSGLQGSEDLDDLLESLGYDPDEMNHHEKIELSKAKLLEEVVNASAAANKLAPGSLPGSIQDELDKLSSPKLTWQDLVKHASQKIRQDKGRFNDWTRFKRRNLSLGMYSPKKKDDSINWLCLLDTSGSMSGDDMAYGVSQLKCLDNRSSGIVVPCDAKPYWDKAVDIFGMEDLPKINLVGRGGTCFNEFFKDYKLHIRKNIDLIIVITDGGVYVDPLVKPPVDVVWVITNNHMPSLPFGRVAPLRSY